MYGGTVHMQYEYVILQVYCSDYLQLLWGSSNGFIYI